MEKLTAITIMVSVAIASIAGLIYTDKIVIDELAESISTSAEVHELQNQIRVLGDRVDEVKLQVNTMIDDIGK